MNKHNGQLNKTTKTNKTSSANVGAKNTKNVKNTKSAKVVAPKRSKAKTIWAGIGLILLPLAVGFGASALTMDIMNNFGELNQPPFAPPAWLFPVAWTILYILMGVASFLIWKKIPRNKAEKSYRRAELIIYFIQLFFNFWWTLFFFRFELRYFAFAWLLVMWGLILALIIMTCKNSKAAMWCLVPYILWCTFAAVLNISVAILN